jgi:Protein of unknown function (DUF2937)
MALLRNLVDRIVLVVGVLAGGTSPSFLAQYRQRVSGHLDQVQRDLAPFQEIADRFHGGSLEVLVQYHLLSTDATFHAEGGAIRAMMDAAEQLRVTLDGLSGDIFHQMWFLVRHQEPELLRATWTFYQPAFAFNVESLIIAIVFGIAIWSLFLALWSTGAWLVLRLRGA